MGAITVTPQSVAQRYLPRVHDLADHELHILARLFTKNPNLPRNMETDQVLSALEYILSKPNTQTRDYSQLDYAKIDAFQTLADIGTEDSLRVFIDRLINTKGDLAGQKINPEIARNAVNSFNKRFSSDERWRQNFTLALYNFSDEDIWDFARIVQLNNFQDTNDDNTLHELYTALSAVAAGEFNHPYIIKTAQDGLELT